MATKTIQSKLPLCNGCRDNYYNHNTPGGCWLLQQAKVVTRFRLGWWTRPTEPGAYEKVITLDCHHAPGQYAQHEKLPDCFPDAAAVEKSKAYDARKA